ncbi:ABC transporter transmembrane domain-containing protein [Ramlibacter montanisoli]|uniref:ABC transmembrane type-1 domain-containing protein n=1 Tax=Ramlibacter montanisoli TaxID=2732512 RepID=A0A849K6U6_9BURK|nr:ABC transporter transmembrane domain-containing protein [Ramlibacter montanisoli]NNU43270.1 hypothetical protein [Ramlibacter montanisoli]
MSTQSNQSGPAERDGTGDSAAQPAEHKPAVRAASDPREVASLFMTRMNMINGKKDELSMAMNGMFDLTRQLIRNYAEQQLAIENLRRRVKTLEAAVPGQPLRPCSSQQPRHSRSPRTSRWSAMKPLLSELRPMMGAIAAFSFVINLLFLVPAFFTLQVFDRVISTNSSDTLLVLLAGTAVALLILMFLDYVRTRLQNVVGNLVDERLSPPVVNAIVVRAARSSSAARIDGIRDVASLRAMFSANGLIAVFDAPWVVIYVLVIWMFHPYLGIGAALSALLMLGLAWLNDRLSRGALEHLQKEGRRASQYVESSLRNAEVLQALGMTHRLLARWRTLQNKVAALQTSASRSTATFTVATKTVRQAIQILMLALGAYLVLTQQASPAS